MQRTAIWHRFMHTAAHNTFLPPPPPVYHPVSYTAPSHKAESSAMALQRIADIYRTQTISPTNQPARNSMTTRPDRKQKYPQRDKSPTPNHLLPPAIHRLLNARLYKLAVSHTLSTPEYASDEDLLAVVASRLEIAGAGKLALRLNRLAAQQRLGTQRKPADYWKLPVTASRPNSLPFRSRQETITAHYNSHLTSMLTLAHPTSPITPPRPKSRSTSSLRQLKHLLLTVNKLEKHRGFVPDIVTANIIIKCWLKSCTAPNDIGDSRMSTVDLRLLFQMVKSLVDRSVRGSGSSDPNFFKHIRPFGKMMAAACRQVGEGDLVAEITVWLKEMREHSKAERLKTEDGERSST